MRPSRARRSTVLGCKCKRRATSLQSSRCSNGSCGLQAQLGSKLLFIQKRRRRRVTRSDKKECQHFEVISMDHHDPGTLFLPRLIQREANKTTASVAVPCCD